MTLSRWLFGLLVINGITPAYGQAADAEVAPMPTVPFAALDEALDIRGEELNARIYETRLSLDVKINGDGPFRFVVDSGADRSVIGQNLARRLALPPSEPVDLITVVETLSVPTVHVSSLGMGSSEIERLRMPVLSEQHIGAQGLLGIDALADQRLMMDFERKKVVIEDARHRLPSLPGEIVVTARRLKGQLIITQVIVQGRKVMAVIDSGSMVTVGNLALQSVLLGKRRSVPTTFGTIIGVTGATLTVPFINMPEVQIGSMRLTNVPIAFADLPPFEKFGLATEPALLLGTDALQAFSRVSLDFRRRRIRFQLRQKK